jgi:hypothetical protein
MFFHAPFTRIAERNRAVAVAFGAGEIAAAGDTHAAKMTARTTTAFMDDLVLVEAMFLPERGAVEGMIEFAGPRLSPSSREECPSLLLARPVALNQSFISPSLRSGLGYSFVNYIVQRVGRGGLM